MRSSQICLKYLWCVQNTQNWGRQAKSLKYLFFLHIRSYLTNYRRWYFLETKSLLIFLVHLAFQNNHFIQKLSDWLKLPNHKNGNFTEKIYEFRFNYSGSPLNSPVLGKFIMTSVGYDHKSPQFSQKFGAINGNSSDTTYTVYNLIIYFLYTVFVYSCIYKKYIIKRSTPKNCRV